jgi:hypothetical protein
MIVRRFVVLGLCAVGALTALPALAGESAAPFGVDRRPQPQGANLEQLLPATVGTFRREALAKDARLASDEDLNVSYVDGKDSVDVGLSRPETVEDAREAIKVSRDEAVQSKVPMTGARLSLKTDPAYFQAGDFIAWSRGTYFFYAKASSPAALARFMTAFPY